MKVAVGSDHAGLNLKNLAVAHLLSRGYDVVDVGTHEATSCAYPDFAKRVAELVRSGDTDRGVLICGTGQGMAMTANKVPGVRAAVVSDPFSARQAMAHNDARVLCMGERVIGQGVAMLCLDAWLEASFEGGRHQTRVEMMES